MNNCFSWKKVNRSKGKSRKMRKKISIILYIVCLLSLGSLSIQAKTWRSLNSVSQAEEEVFFQVLSENSNEIAVEFEIPGVIEQEILKGGEYYMKLDVPGAGTTQEPGKPELPVVTKVIEVPEGADVSVTILNRETVTLSGYRIFPFQLTYDSTEEDIFQKNSDLYSKDAFYPEREVLIGSEMKMRGHSLVPVTINPFRYNPHTGELSILSYFQAIIEYSSDGSRNVSPNKVSPLFDNLVANTVINSPPSRSTSESELSNISRYTDSGSSSGAEYLIITDDNFYDPSDPDDSPVQIFAEHKIEKGLTVKIVTLSEIGSSPSSDDIRSYIQNAYNNWTQPPVYLLLIGDGGQIPVSEVNGIPTDLYYGAVDSSNDFLPDILVGRFPSATLAELTIIVDKSVDYEEDESIEDWKNRILTAAYFQDNDDNGIGDRGYLETAEEANEYLNSIGYNSRAVYTTNSTNPTTYYNGETISEYLKFTEATQATQDIIDIINEGVLIAAHRDHGSVFGWAYPNFNINHISSLSNTNKLPMIFAVNCSSGRYHDTDGFGEQLVEYDGGGAIGYVGASVGSPTQRNHKLYAGLFDALFEDYRANFSTTGIASNKMGMTMLHGKMFLYSTDGAGAQSVFEMYNLQGDPELDIRRQSYSPTSITAMLTVIL
jgi:hypothetical protein